MNTMIYKGYAAHIEYSNEDGCFIGHIAGIGAAINGFVSTIMAVPIATFIGSYINETALPLFIGFFVCGFLSLLLIASLKFKKKEGLVLKST